MMMAVAREIGLICCTCKSFNAGNTSGYGFRRSLSHEAGKVHWFKKRSHDRVEGHQQTVWDLVLPIGYSEAFGFWRLTALCTQSALSRPDQRNSTGWVQIASVPHGLQLLAIVGIEMEEGDGLVLGGPSLAAESALTKP